MKAWLLAPLFFFVACTPKTASVPSQAEVKLDPEVGKQIYRQVCAGCHVFSSGRMGPSVVYLQEKYKDNPKGIVDYAMNPVRTQLKFPPMPNHAYLGEPKLTEVAKYILQLKK